MRNLILLILFISFPVFAQQNSAQWEKVISLEKEGKISSANEIVSKIYEQSVKTKNEPEIIKCFFYRSKYLMAVDENAQSKIIENLRSEITKVSPASSALLNFVYATCLKNYATKNKYKLNNQTTTDLKGNFLTWNFDEIQLQVKAALDKSVAPKNKLKETKISKYDAIFDFAFKSSPDITLYEYLLKENISYYSEEISISELEKNRNEFEDQVLGDSAKFLQISSDSVTDPNFKKLLSLQFELEKYVPTPVTKFERINLYARLYNTSGLKNIKALENIKYNAGYDALKSQIQLKKAEIYKEMASKKEFPEAYITAVKTLDSILEFNDHSNTFKTAMLTKEKIVAGSLSINLKKFVYPNENTRALITHKNINSFKISYFLISDKILSLLNNRLIRDSIIDHITTQKNPVKSVTTTLNFKKDYFSYSTEILLPQLEIGTYLVYIYNPDDKQKPSNNFTTVTVSNLVVAAVNLDLTNNYTVYNRKSGKPVEGVTLTSSRFELQTNKNGLAEYTLGDKETNNFIITAFKDKDTITFNDNYTPFLSSYKNKDNKDESFKAKVFFYLDRGIYRPGQTVYFKGVAIKKDSGKSEVIPNLTLQISISDNSYNEIKNYDVTTNEFGSFSGEVILPKNVVTGEFTISAEEPDNLENDPKYNKVKEEHPFWDNIEIDFENSEQSFSVEEYKRPKFEIVFDPIKDNFMAEQKVSVAGTAKAFAGSSVSDAKVTYTIIKKASTFSWDNSGNEIMETGATTTDKTGKFKIEFLAKPSAGIEKKSLPVFEYAVKVAIQDINSETRSAETSVNAGYHALNLNVTLPQKIRTNEKTTILLSSNNLNDQFCATKGIIKIFYQRPFPTGFKPAPWDTPDYETISTSDFKKLFPYEGKLSRDTITNPVLVYSRNVDTQKEKKVILDSISEYKSGYYQIVFFAVDSMQNPVKTSRNFEIVQSFEKTVSNQLLTIIQTNKDAKKDGFAEFLITSPIKELHITAGFNTSGKLYENKSIDLRNYKSTFRIPIQKEIKRNVNAKFETVFDNHVYTENTVVVISEITPSIEFETQSFRSKIEPGSNEKWSFRISKNSNYKETEVLASMYDSSLDQFAKSFWEGPEFYEYNNNNSEGRSFEGFQDTFVNLNLYRNLFLNFRNETTELMWFGFNFTKDNNVSDRKYKAQMARKVNKSANSKWISGIISDHSGLPIPGANIYVLGTNRSVQSDFDGFYEIEAKKNEILVYKFLGFIEKQLTVGSDLEYNIHLEEDSVMLEGVVVTAQGITKEKKALGNATRTTYATYNYEDDSLLKSLTGRVAGVNIVHDSTGLAGAGSKIVIRGYSSVDKDAAALIVIDGMIATSQQLQQLKSQDLLSASILQGAAATALYGAAGTNGVLIVTTTKVAEELTQIKPRANLSETAFFFPELKVDKNGIVNFTFTTPEALTLWKMRLFAHNKKAQFGYLEQNVVTQKDLMLLPNFPRFLRERDTITITSKVSNITDVAKSGIAILQFYDATTMENIDSKMGNAENVRNFNLAAFGNGVVSWKIIIPEGLQGVQYKILAKSGSFSDGEENILPVLSNNILVTETIPLWVRGNTSKTYTFENLKNNDSATLKNHQFTLEYTSNPAWLAIKSLPYLMEYEHECSEQTFARFYANAIASEIIGSNPKIAAVFEKWRSDGKAASKLQQNEELKSIVQAETPWLLDSESEDAKKKNLALLFDLEKMKTSQESIFQKLKQKQFSSGGFPWFDGGSENTFITRHILSGIGHLQKLNIKSFPVEKYSEITKPGVAYSDRKFLENYELNKKQQRKNSKISWLSAPDQLHYLYIRSFYLTQYPLSNELQLAVEENLKQIETSWPDYALYEKGLAALTFHRFSKTDIAVKILESLKESASNNVDWGMYWISNKSGWNWNQAPIETQALLIEAFGEITKDKKSVDEMKVWLLKTKQNTSWPTTKSTSEAIYALLLQGSDWLSVKDNTTITIGDQKLLTQKIAANEKESEAGYLKLNWKADEISKNMASISVTNNSSVPGYGGVYWQYFENLDQIKSDGQKALSVSKELFIKSETVADGKKLHSITATSPLKIGQLITVRLIITASENIEFVHLKDMRASCFEPVTVLSTYEQAGGLSFYKSTRDAATHFFFDTISKGTYILEYEVRVNNSGKFSNGISTIQSMYAPEFSGHSKGMRVHVEE